MPNNKTLSHDEHVKAFRERTDLCGAEHEWDSTNKCATVYLPYPGSRVVSVMPAIQETSGTADKKLAYRMMLLCLDVAPRTECYIVLIGEHWGSKAGMDVAYDLRRWAYRLGWNLSVIYMHDYEELIATGKAPDYTDTPLLDMLR